MFAISSIQIATTYVWGHNGSSELQVQFKASNQKGSEDRKMIKKKMPASMSIVHHKTNLIYKHLVEAVWEEDAEKIWAHRGW